MGILFLVRHGETLWNQEARYQGQLDIELSTRGWGQARAVAKRLASSSIHAVYSSDLQRARQTADLIAYAHKLRTIEDERLRETNFGVWQGLTRDEIRDQYPETFAQRYSTFGQLLIPGAEPACTVQKRMLAALGEIAARHQQETAVIVSHGGAMRLVFCHILGLNLDQAFRIRIYNTSLSELQIDTATFSSDNFAGKIARINDISHLRHHGVIDR